MKPARFLSSIAFLAVNVHANTEKIIFVAPPANHISQLGELRGLDVLAPATPSLRTALSVAFPTATASKEPQGVESWFLLSDLNPGQRYEVRVCWAAVQPTTFWIDTFEPSAILDDEQLFQKLSDYSQSRTDKAAKTANDQRPSVLFLRITAAADFFTTNATLMQHPPPVDVDIILDPFIGNIFPKSLVPTVIYIIALAIGSWLISGYAWQFLTGTSNAQPKKPHTD
ncbi:uncharacterized protein LTR77_002668 [Saxophila tyrrhenica]|uniref:Uncharacterized protein n=1 Tax=Saxophila tyrrhenica TaxID=1690608 RepID=A0AAV9PJF9_9PEZI|nr:hypothetical protein LTR77_002668 [Saxophila tyrrhenica]